MFRRLRNRARSERAATDPILVIAAIAVSLILLVGGGFAVSGWSATRRTSTPGGETVGAQPTVLDLRRPEEQLSRKALTG